MVKIQVRWVAAHPGQDRRLLGVVTHSRPERASARSWVGIRATWLRGRYRLGHHIVWGERGNTEHFGELDQRRNGAELVLIHQTETGTRLLNL